MNLDIIDKVLPPPTDWKFHLDLWENPYAVAHFHEVEPLRDGIKDAEKIRILREELKTKNRPDDLAYLNKVVAEFNITEKPEDLEGILSNVKKVLNELAKKNRIEMRNI